VPELNSRINARVKRMVEAGLVAETRALADRLGPTAREALGTKQILRHLAGECTLDEAIEQTKIETRRFAKNQRTWMRRLAATPGARIVRPADRPLADIAQDVVNSILPA
ncbi:MAG: tRNA dimethylallyltransferase, partial [Planctomycetota bacterium]